MKRIKKLKTGFFSRHLKVAGILASLAKDYYTKPQDEFIQTLRVILSKRADNLSEELGQLKGSLLKAGQMLSMFSKDILPPEVENLFKSLESESSYLDWTEISKQIPPTFLKELSIEEEPFAAASIGQVHKAQNSEGSQYALKIQYQNIEKVIAMDLRILRWLINLFKLVPKDILLDEVFLEIESMLHQEIDYKQERQNMEKYKELAGDRYIVPKLNKSFCNEKILCSEFITGLSVESAIKNANQNERNKLAKDFFQLFYLELFEWNLVQTDAHLGIYLIANNKWVLLDFGAVKKLPVNISKTYQELIRALILFDKTQIEGTLKKLDLINWEKTNLDFLWEYLHMITQPLRLDSYDWGSSDLAQRAINMNKKIIMNISLKKAPAETMFIDRKVAGLFYMLKVLGATGDIRPDQFKSLVP